jgi:hypothetical protein
MKKELPRFIIYQPNDKEYHICMEADGQFLRWCSYYPPTLDVRYAREVNRIDDLPLKKLPRKNIYDQGTYAVTSKDSKEVAEQKLLEGVEQKSFAFILKGEQLKGRFALKQKGNRTVLQKFKDKYAIEEDVLSGDLERTIHTMIPDYDPDKVNLNRQPKIKRPTPAEEEHPEEPTPDITIGGTYYHFALYTAEDEPDVCVITNDDGEVVVLKKENGKWQLLRATGKSALKHEKEFLRHVNALKF